MAPSATSKHPALGDISVLFLDVMARAVMREGCSIQPLFDQFSISQTLLNAPEARISIPRFMRLGSAAISLTGNPNLGLTMGTETRPVDAGLAGLAAMTAPTASQGLEQILTYSLLNSRNSRGHPHFDRDSLTARFYSIRPYNRYNYFVVDSVLGGWTRFLRRVTGEQAVLRKVMIEYPDLGQSEVFEQWFGCPVVFGAEENSVQLHRDIAPLIPAQAQPAMHRALVQQCNTQLERIRGGWNIIDQVKEKLTPLLQGQTPSLETVAAELGLGPWTLQRQLAAHGARYKDLLDDTRKALALDYVKETNLNFAEIAWILGFSGSPAFYKAYRRWLGMSPGDYRAQYAVRNVNG